MHWSLSTAQICSRFDKTPSWAANELLAWFPRSWNLGWPLGLQTVLKRIEASLASYSHSCWGVASLGGVPCICICIYIYIYIYSTPPPRYPGLGLVQMCFDRGSRRTAQICKLEDQRKEVCLIEERRLGRDPCPFSMALPHKIPISSHTNHALFQRLFHRKFTHPLTQHMSFYMCSFNETKSAYVKEFPRKGNPV